MEEPGADGLTGTVGSNFNKVYRTYSASSIEPYRGVQAIEHTVYMHLDNSTS